MVTRQARELLEQYPLIAITGPRPAGKTIHPSFFKNLPTSSKLAGPEQVELFLVYGGDSGQMRSDLRVAGWGEAARVIAKTNPM